MECSSLYNKNSVNGTLAFFPRTPENINCHTFPSTCSFPLNSTNPFATLSSSSAVKCYGQNYGDEEALSTSLAYDVLGVAPNCSADELKSAFRNKVLFPLSQFMWNCLIGHGVLREKKKRTFETSGLK